VVPSLLLVGPLGSSSPHARSIYAVSMHTVAGRVTVCSALAQDPVYVDFDARSTSRSTSMPPWVFQVDFSTLLMLSCCSLRFRNTCRPRSPAMLTFMKRVTPRAVACCHRWLGHTVPVADCLSELFLHQQEGWTRACCVRFGRVNMFFKMNHF